MDKTFLFILAATGIYSIGSIVMIILAKKKGWTVRIRPVYTLVSMFIFVLCIIAVATGKTLTDAFNMLG